MPLECFGFVTACGANLFAVATDTTIPVAWAGSTDHWSIFLRYLWQGALTELEGPPH